MPLTDRAKNGSKRGVLTEGDCEPLPVSVAPANVHNSLVLQDILETVVVQPRDPRKHEQHLYLDKAFEGAPCQATPKSSAISRKSEASARRKRQPGPQAAQGPTLGDGADALWLNRCRTMLIRWDKNAENY